MAKLSVIVPVYQVKPYLERCLKSIISQSFSDYEIILVDDGSTDGSQAICDLYAERYNCITVIHKMNGGLSSARNAGIEAASGDYLMFVDSDDLIHVNAAELEIKALEESDADALICSFKRFQTESEIDFQTPIKELKDITVKSGFEVERDSFHDTDVARYVSSCGKVYKRKLFDSIRFPEGRLFEDEYTTYKLYYDCKKIIVTNSELYYYFVNPDGITQNLSLNKRFDEYDAQIERINFYSDKNEKALYRLALLEFLRSAQWDLITYQDGKQACDHERGLNFQAQYVSALDQAEKEKIVSFIDNYDYYVLAFPQKKTMLRLKRQILKQVGKMK